MKTIEKSLKINKVNKPFKRLFLLLLICFLSLWYFSEKYAKKLDDNYSAACIQKNLLRITSLLDSSIKNIETSARLEKVSFEKLMKEKEICGCEFFYLNGDTIKYWTTNLIDIENYNIEHYPIIKLNNGWYKSKVVQNADYKIIGLIPIKFEYKFNNKFLKESFNNELKVNSYYNIALTQGEFNVWENDGKFLFSIESNEQKQISKSQVYVLFVLFHLVLLLLLIIAKTSYQVFRNYFKHKWTYPIIVIVDVCIIWSLIYLINSPQLLFNSFLYSGEKVSGQLQSYIGTYFTNTVLLLFLVYLLITKRVLVEYIFLNPKIRVVFLFVLNIFCILFFERSIIDIFKNSSLSYQFGQDFITNPGLTIIYFLILSMHSLGLFWLIQSMVIELKDVKIEKINFMILGIIFTTALIVLTYFFTFNFLYTILLFAFLLFTMWLMNVKKYSAIQLVFYIMIFSIYMSLVSSEILKEKEIKERKLLAENLLIVKDTLAEKEYPEIEKNIYKDTLLLYELNQSLSDSIEEIITKKIKSHFLTGAWKNYTSYIVICDNTKVLDVQPEDYLINCYEYFKDLIENYSDSRIGSLIHLESNDLNNSYITHLTFDLNNDGSKDIHIYVELISEFIPEGVGYAELVTDESYNVKSNKIINYSFAKYIKDELVYKFGSYSFDMDFSQYENLISKSNEFGLGGYSHLVYGNESGDKIIISSPQRSSWEKIAPFSYFFILFSLVVLIFTAISDFPLKVFNLPLSFRKRIQLSFTGIIFFSFLVIGYVTLFYLFEINNNKNKEILNEKAHSVLVELEHKLSNETNLTADMTDYLNTLLNKFSLVFFSDINLYNLEGRLIATSRSRVVNEGLISPLIHPQAYRILNENKKLLFIQDESIGKYNYLSAYLPFRNSTNQKIAYLNLPYFARQSEIQKEITTFLVALVNIYLLFFIIAIIITLIISRNMSMPLELIRTRIAELRIGEINKKINWKRKDELGSLINEYNRMIDELSKSANLLAKSERESAWREMAKQVAHEIKNPLTPMKLSVQYLKKKWEEKTPGWEEQLDRFSTTIIQQIDTLSEIATAFSDFAKMPQKKTEHVDIKDVIYKSTGIFKEHEHVKIEFNPGPDKFLIIGDKNQLIRMFNNLIKNSIQAFGDKKNGKINIKIKKTPDTYLISVKDNGIGIPSERAERIFSPSFTTKTSGMGLGLSIVKSIVLDTGGKIWFESINNKGTTFYIEFPTIKVEK